MISKKANSEGATDYLLGSKANKKRLLKSIKNVNKRVNLIEINLKDLKEIYNKVQY